MLRVGIITASDKGSKGERVDLSGELILSIMEKESYEVVQYEILPDEQKILEEVMIKWCDEEGVDLILTTGGTGFSKRDVTPEATKAIIEKEALGIAEAMRYHSLKITDRAMLSRAVAGIRGETLIVNLPGSPKAVQENLEYLLPTLRHGLEILIGKDSECART